ncbi:hypothetical protein [Sphingomonas sp. NFR15]|uniref:hypothetical protein n=1 Tax=Sphingomonas sp. NFR15 TaxID=1566282 RepID=UPI00087F9C0F|nr:hypothetical protein [Sphingomonas sp. NFR15]SDA36233.1 hypothetical protein SAMN03159340_03579 [Sphingomonas sp. NFR15]
MMLDRLPRLDPAEARLRETVPAALSGRRCADGTLVARIPAAPSTARWWYACANEAAFALLLRDGRDARLLADDGPTAAEALEACEPLLREIELGLGIALVPERLVEAPAHTPIVEVTALAEGIARQRLLLALPLTLMLHPAAPEFAPELLGGVSVRVAVRIAGPRLAPHAAASLAPGDLLLLENPLAATLHVSGQAPLAGRFDPAAARFIPA